jgi:hypothetical protein
VDSRASTSPPNRAAHLNGKWAVAAEEYDDIGPLRKFYKSGEQFHELWEVFDHYAKLDLEAGIGFGLAQGSAAPKQILSRDLYHAGH